MPIKQKGSGLVQIVKTIAVIVPVIAGPLGTYLKMRADAAVGYETLAKALADLEKHNQESHIEVERKVRMLQQTDEWLAAEMTRYEKALQRISRSPQAGSPSTGTGMANMSIDLQNQVRVTRSAITHEAAPRKLLEIPETFSEALEKK